MKTMYFTVKKQTFQHLTSGFKVCLGCIKTYFTLSAQHCFLN